MGNPLFSDGSRLGAAVFQITMDRLNTVMSDSTGLGKTGETYLVGQDRLMRTRARFDDETTTRGLRVDASRLVDTEAVRLALEGASGTVRQKGYRGVDVLASYGPLQLPGLQWAIVASIDMSEVTAPAQSLRTRVAAFAIVLIVLIPAAGFFLLHGVLIKPMRRLLDGAQGLERGDYSRRVPIHSNDEMGRLSAAFNKMGDSIASDIEERKRSRNALEEAHRKLEQQNLRYQHLTTNLPASLYQFAVLPDGTRTFPYISPNLRKTFEVYEEDTAEATAAILGRVQSDAAAFEQSVVHAVTTLEPWHHVFRILTPSGKMLWLEGGSRPHRQPDGNVHWDGLLLDITERKQTEDALRKSEQRLAVQYEIARVIASSDTLAEADSHNSGNDLQGH